MEVDRGRGTGHRPKTFRRWLRLSALSAGGVGDILLEDANDLAEWQSRLPTLANGMLIYPPRVPPFTEWCPPEVSDDDILAGISASLGI